MGYLRDLANKAANKAKGNFPPSNCAKVFGACSEGPKCCQDGCVCTPKAKYYSQCQIPDGFEGCTAAAVGAAEEEARTSNAAASEAEGIADAKRKAAQAAANAQEHENKVSAAREKSKQMDEAAAKAEAKVKQMKIALKRASKLEIR